MSFDELLLIKNVPLSMECIKGNRFSDRCDTHSNSMQLFIQSTVANIIIRKQENIPYLPTYLPLITIVELIVQTSFIGKNFYQEVTQNPVDHFGSY